MLKLQLDSGAPLRHTHAHRHTDTHEHARTHTRTHTRTQTHTHTMRERTPPLSIPVRVHGKRHT
jgi:hypothetical protein